MANQAEEFMIAYKAKDTVLAFRLFFQNGAYHDNCVSEDYVVLFFDDDSKCCYSEETGEVWEVAVNPNAE